ncbi:hypothetical protein [Streptomyces sp. URMC 123]|uniref:hypothetical protein n=1 Tax=Streptomyces sp. URMC 123 TaxID=3423403 RepID=UPI003F19D89B
MRWDDIVDELYVRHPSEFVAARDRAAAGAPRGQAARIRALRRPTLAAWAVNLLVRADRDQVDALLGLGEQLRRAHRELDGTRLRELARQQRRLVAALSQQAADAAAAAGHPVTEGVRREVEATVHAALADPAAARELAGGRLTKALPPPVGFGPLIGDGEAAGGPAEAGEGESGGGGEDARGAGEIATVHPLRPAAARGAETPRLSRRAAPVRNRGTDARGASVTDLHEHAEERARERRERRERLAEARREVQAAERAARASAKDATAAERVLAEASRRRAAAEERVAALAAELAETKGEVTAARQAERAAVGPARRARGAADADRVRAEEAADRLAHLRDSGDSPGGDHA